MISSSGSPSLLTALAASTAWTAAASAFLAAALIRSGVSQLEKSKADRRQ